MTKGMHSMHWRTTTKESDLKQQNTHMHELMCSVCFSRRIQCSLTLSGWASLRRKWESWKTSWTMSPGGEKLNWLLCCPSLSFYTVLLCASLGPHLRNKHFCLWYFNPHLFNSPDCGETWRWTLSWKTSIQQQKPNTGWRRNRGPKPERGRRMSSSGRPGWDCQPIFFIWTLRDNRLHTKQYIFRFL